MLQRTVCINKITIIQRTQMVRRTRRNTIGRRSTGERMTCSVKVLTRERLFMIFMCVRLLMLFIRKSLFIVITKEIFNVNKNPTRCNSMQIFIYCKVTLHVSGVKAPVIRSTKNCNRSLRYRS